MLDTNAVSFLCSVQRDFLKCLAHRCVTCIRISSYQFISVIIIKRNVCRYCIFLFQLVFGNCGVLQGIGPGKAYVDMSTVDMETVADIHEVRKTIVCVEVHTT